MKKQIVTMLLVTATLAACSSSYKQETAASGSSVVMADIKPTPSEKPVMAIKPPPPPIGISKGQHEDFFDDELFKARDFLYRGEKVDSPVYGLVIFTSKPVGKEQEQKYIEICKTWEGMFLPKSVVAPELKSKTFLTYWPSTNIHNGSCFNLHNYDYAYAEELLYRLKIKKSGPFLLAVYEHGKDIRHAELDLSPLTDPDIKRVFTTWKYDLTVTKKGWNKSFNLIYFREKFKYILNGYGKELLEFKA